MTYRRLPAAVIAIAAFVCLSSTGAFAQQKETPINQLYLEVSALSALYDLDATPEQMKALKELSTDTAAKKLPPDVHPGRPYRSALTALRDAYLKGDDNEISDCDERLANLEEKMDNPPDPQAEVTDAARKKAGDAVKLFTPAQIADYIAARTDDAPDPQGEIVAALDEIRGQDEKAFQKTRRHLADEVATQLAGLEGGERKSVSESVIALLDKARGLSDDDFKAKRADLDKEAKEITAGVSPLVIVGHWIERDLAELLSNPQLAPALAGRMK